jgi:flagellar biosynthesis/type III secretory pathway protein FliH
MLLPIATHAPEEQFDDAPANDIDDIAEEDAEYADAQADTLRELRLFNARVIEGVEAAVETLLGDIAAEVLGRELQLAPADLQTIVDRALQRYMADEPLRVRAHPTDALAISCALPLVADERLRSGDIVLELRCGSVDGTLGVRLAGAIRKAHP